MSIDDTFLFGNVFILSSCSSNLANDGKCHPIFFCQTDMGDKLGIFIYIYIYVWGIGLGDGVVFYPRKRKCWSNTLF